MDYYFFIEVKNNTGVPTKFHGTFQEFEKAFMKYFEFDTFGKIIDWQMHTHEEVCEMNNIKDGQKIRDNLAAIEYQETIGRFIEEDERSKVNKRYRRYLS